MSVSSSPPHTLAPTQSAFTHVSEHLHIIALSTVFFFAIDVLSAPFGRAHFPKQFAGFSKKTERVWRSRAVGEYLRFSYTRSSDAIKGTFAARADTHTERSSQLSFTRSSASRFASGPTTTLRSGTTRSLGTILLWGK
jgi:hypothetical protein